MQTLHFAHESTDTPQPCAEMAWSCTIANYGNLRQRRGGGITEHRRGNIEKLIKLNPMIYLYTVHSR
jgi:hypothetical protein